MRGQAPEGRDGRQARYMPRNHTDFTPAAVLVFDTETRRIVTDQGERQPLRLWCARYILRRAKARIAPRDESSHGTTGGELARLIDGYARSIMSLWCYAHNLGYDLHASGVLPALGMLGWSVTAVSSVSRYLWLSMARHSASCPKHPAMAAGDREQAGKCRCPTIRFCDTTHLWPMKLAAVGDLLGVPKLPMPAQDADDSAWVRYCARDVDVAAAALLTAMDYWDEHKLGRWAATNAATGSNTLRHTLPGKPPVLIDDAEGVALDRAAVYGGRRQCWRHGELPPGRYSEIDIKAAYATVGANWPLPFKRGAWFNSLPVDDHRIDHSMITCIAECEVETDVPRWPVRTGEAVDYPVGRFTTTLAGPEIAWARELGCLRRIGRGQWHLLGTGYQPFFQRVLDLGRPGESGVPPVVAALWKQFGRTVIGKFAQHGYKITDTGMLSAEILRYEQEVSGQDGKIRALIHYGGRIWRAEQDGDGPNAYPAVTAMVESRVRVALGKAAEIIGPAAMVLCDTDGLWCSTGEILAGHTGQLPYDLSATPQRERVGWVIDSLSAALSPFTFREKHVSARFKLAGPQVYDADTASKASGRPGGLTRQGNGTWTGQTFPSFAWQQSHSQPGIYQTRLASWQWPATHIRGWCLDSGHVLPLEAACSPPGPAAVLPWRPARASPGGAALAPIQHPGLAGLWDERQHTARTGEGHEAIWETSRAEAQRKRNQRRREAGIREAPEGMPAVLGPDRDVRRDVPGRIRPAAAVTGPQESSGKEPAGIGW